MSHTAGYLCLQATREGQASHAHVHEIIGGLRSLGWQVDLFEPSYASAGTPIPGAIGRLLEFLRTQRRCARKLRSFEVLYVRSHPAIFPLALLARLRGCRVVQEVNGPYEDLFTAWPWTRRMASILKRAARSQLRWADAIITVTPELRDWVLGEIGSGSVTVIPNAANTALFRPLPTMSRTLPFDYVVFFGSLAPWHGIDTMLDAVRQPDWPPAVKLVVIGNGAKRAQVEAAAKDDPRIVYLGTVAYRELPCLISQSLGGLCMTVVPNGTGLSPLKLYETLSCGVPVIAADVPGLADLIRPGSCGMVVSPRDPAALAKAVQVLYEAPNERIAMGGRGRALVVQHHSWQQRAERTASVLLATINSTLSRKRRTAADSMA